MPERIRVATYNLYLGADLGLLLGGVPDEQLDEHVTEVLRQLRVTAFPRRAPAIAGLLVRERVDLVGLQEVCTWSTDDEVMWDGAAELLAALAALEEPYDVVATQSSFSGSGEVAHSGRRIRMRLEGRNVILRRRSSAVTVEETSSGMFDSALTMQLLDAGTVTIGRGWCAVRCTAAGQGLTFVNTHTEAYEATSRDEQRSELVAALPEDPRLVLVGDFNALPEDVGMPADVHDGWVAAGNESSGPAASTCCQVGDLTNGTSQLSERIDYVWVRGLAVEACTRFGAEPEDRTDDGLWPSDHAGVVATVVV
jgi:endonuclease/exonuclease/phosphatase family metal-dependent hydrolase